VIQPSPFAQVWIITAQTTAEGQSTFSPAAANAVPVTPVYLANTITTGGSVIQLPYNTPQAAPNAFVVVTQCTNDSSLVGQVLRLGTVVSSPTSVSSSSTEVWSLVPGYDLNANDANLPAENSETVTAGSGTISPASTVSATVEILGCPVTTVSGVITANGPPQDITCTTGIVRVSN
jgi:hypothetical protein